MRRARRDLAWRRVRAASLQRCSVVPLRPNASSSTLWLLAALRVDACGCARAPEEARLPQLCESSVQ